MTTEEPKQLDLSDPAVLQMARFNHTPSEVWARNGALLSVTCETCHKAWPCPTRWAIDVIDEEMQMDAQRGL